MWIEKDRIKSKNNIVVTQAWVSKDLQRLPNKCRSFKVILKYLKLYCQYSSLYSLKYLIDSQRSRFERIVWIIIHCAILSSLIYIVYMSYEEFLTTPTVTSIELDNYPLTSLNFPGIAICSVNRISRQSAMKMATNIFNANITNLPFDEILILIWQLGNLYSSDFQMDENRNLKIDRLLTAYNKTYDITEIMKNLSPQCSMLLIKCKLHGENRNCSEIFEFRKTQDGYCCTFNYARENDDISVINSPVRRTSIKPVIKVKDLGIERGLTVLMDPLLDDYFHPIMPIMGWKVIIFNPQDFPDVASGGVTEVLSIPRTETFIDITPTSFFSTNMIENYPISKRKCVFPKELYNKNHFTAYTYSDCIVDCKVHNIEDICGCRPFFFPQRGKKKYLSRICTNSDLHCLVKYKTKWYTVFPHENKEEMIKNKTMALHCNCYPVCEDITYNVLSSKSWMGVGLYKTDLLPNITITNESVVHVFFSKYGSIRLKQDISSYWYELLSNIGGTCGVFIGCSLISIMEFLYFIVLVLRNLLCKESAIEDDNDDDDNNNRKVRPIPSEIVQTIYWSELVPRSWQSAK